MKPPFMSGTEPVIFDSSSTSFDAAERDVTSFLSFCPHKKACFSRRIRQPLSCRTEDRYLPSIQEKSRERSLEISSFHDIIEAVNVQPMPDGVEHPNRIVSS